MIPWPSPIRDKLERHFQKGRRALFPQELTNLFLELLPCFDKTIFFVDGLDECSPKESDQILYSLERIFRDRSTKLRIFIASRQEMDINRFLPDCLHISVSNENIAPDICVYVEEVVEIKIVRKGLTSAPSVIKDVKTSLVKGSQGM